MSSDKKLEREAGNLPPPESMHGAADQFPGEDAPHDFETARRRRTRVTRIVRQVAPFQLTSTNAAGLFVRQYWTATVQRPFKPRGLMLWGVNHLDSVAAALIGNDLQVVASWGSVPAAWFASSWSFEQVERQVELGKEPPCWNDWTTVEPGMLIRVELEVQFPVERADGVRLLMWGESVR